MRAAVDTNVLVYAEMPHKRGDETRQLLRSCPKNRTYVPVQVCGELYNVLTQKSRLDRAVAKIVVEGWTRSFSLIETSAPVLSSAVELAAEHHLQIWDAIIMSAAAAADCNLLLTEDLQPGFQWRGVTVVNPFAAPASPLLTAFLAQA